MLLNTELMPQQKTIRHLIIVLWMLALTGCNPTNPTTAAGGVIGAAAPAIPDGTAAAAVTNGTSAIEVARGDQGYTYAAFRACVKNTGEPYYQQRLYILRNRSDRTITTQVSFTDAADRNWSAHTLRSAVMAPGESFDVYLTFLPQTAGMHSLSMQITSRAGGAVIEAPVIGFKGRGFDCREEEIIPEETSPPEEEAEPELLEPDSGTGAQNGSAGSTTGAGTGAGTGTATPPAPAPGVIRPEDLIPREQLLECPGFYTEAVSGWNYRRVPSPIQRLQPAVRDKVSASYANLPMLRTTINYIKVPSLATNPAPAQSISWSNAQIRSEIERTIRWYANYCILLTFREVSLRPDDGRQLAVKYDAWLRLLPQNLSMGLNDALSREGDAVLGSAINAAKRVIPNRREVTVLFMDRQVGYVGSRLTQGSFVPTGKNFLGIGLHGADRDDPYILSHELIHALGLANKTTWYHNSGDVRSMSRITRRSISDPAELSAARLLDFAEYKVIRDAGVVR